MKVLRRAFCASETSLAIDPFNAGLNLAVVAVGPDISVCDTVDRGSRSREYAGHQSDHGDENEQGHTCGEVWGFLSHLSNWKAMEAMRATGSALSFALFSSFTAS